MGDIGVIAVVGIVGFVIIAIVALSLNRPFKAKGNIKSKGMNIEIDGSKSGGHYNS